MKKCVMFALLSLAVLNVLAVSNVYWKTWNILPTVYEFSTDANWMYSNYTTAYVPGTNDYARFNFFVNGGDLWTTRDWRIHFSESITNYAIYAWAPLYGHHATFDLDQKEWSPTYDFNLELGRGGRIVLTNGVMKVRYLNLNPKTDLAEVQTNGIWVATDMDIKVNSNFTVDGTHAVLNGGANPALNRMTVDGQMYIGRYNTSGYKGTGIVSLCGGTYTNTLGSGYHYLGHDPNTYGRLEVSGGTNQLCATGAQFIIGRQGRGTVSVSGGLNVFDGSNTFIGFYAGSMGALEVSGGQTVFNGNAFIGWYSGCTGVLEVTGGRLDVLLMQVGREGQGSFTCTGGEVNSQGSIYIGVVTNGVGAVTISGGTVTTGNDVAMGLAGETVADLTLSGSGLLRCRRIYKVNAAALHAGLLFDGGTLQASRSGTVIDVLDEVSLTTNGLMLDTDGKDVSIRSVLQNQTGHAGSLTKKGAGTLTLAAARTATGPVSVLGGTLVASNALAVAEGLSTVNGTLTLASGSLSIAAGAAIAGTGAVSSLELAENAVLMRAKADGATTPLQADSLSTDGPLSIALTGYTVGDLQAMLPLVRTPSPLDVSQVTVTVDGETLPGVRAVARTDQGQNLLGVKYFCGTLISVY